MLAAAALAGLMYAGILEWLCCRSCTHNICTRGLHGTASMSRHTRDRRSSSSACSRSCSRPNVLRCCFFAGDNTCIALSSLRSIALRITEHVCVKHSCSGDSTCAGTALSATKWSGGDARFGFGDIILFALRFVCFFFYAVYEPV